MAASPARWAVVPTEQRMARPDVHWAQLGDDTVIWTHDERTTLDADGAAAGVLALVIQVGSAFTDRHPEVPVLVSRGRHLVVDAAELPDEVDTDGLCWRSQPLPADTVVVDRPLAVPGRLDPIADELLAAMSATDVEHDLRELTRHRTRHSLSTGFTAAADWAAARLETLGLAVTTAPVRVGSGTSTNVIADHGDQSGDARELVVLTAHLDSVNSAGGAAAPAPGADDNASGVAGVLELARLLSPRRWRHDLRVILFGGEEQGLLGSTQHVAALPTAERARIRAVLNLDMIARRNTTEAGVLLEGAAGSSALIADLAEAAATCTGLRVSTSLIPFASDHVPFIDAGIPAVLTIEDSDRSNTDVHSERDVLDRLDLALAAEILSMDLVATVGWLQAVARPQPAGPVVSTMPGRLDVFASGTSGDVVHETWTGQG